MNENTNPAGEMVINSPNSCGIQRPELNKHFAVINPSRICQPMGALQALLGVKGAMPLIHGSQGCSTYMRFQLCRHFREPVNVSSSSMSEATVVYGGEENLIKALDTVCREYHPEIIGVTSSCLTETIGDDMNLIINKFRHSRTAEQISHYGGKIPVIIPISTPSYKGSHVEGYDQALRSLVEHLAYPSNDDSTKNNPKNPNYPKFAPEINPKINIVPGNLSPADVRGVKDILDALSCNYILLTDNSESLDAPLTDSIHFLPWEGTTLDQIRDTANSKATISLSKHVDSAGKLLEKIFGVPSISGPLPVGLKNTDEFISNVARIMNLEIPESIHQDRGRLIDALVDAHPYNYQRKAAIYGDPDVVTGMARFLSEMGMVPFILCTGTQSPRFVEDVESIAREYSFQPLVMEGCDLYDLHAQIKSHPVDLLVGNSYGARIAKEEETPLLRMGFPVYDRMGAQRISMVGYQAGTQLLDTITNMILEKYYDDSGWEMAK